MWRTSLSTKWTLRRWSYLEETAAKVNKAKANGNRVFAVGITTVRALETYVTTQNEIKELDTWTNRFIFHPINSLFLMP